MSDNFILQHLEGGGEKKTLYYISPHIYKFNDDYFHPCFLNAFVHIIPHVNINLNWVWIKYFLGHITTKTHDRFLHLNGEFFFGFILVKNL